MILTRLRTANHDLNVQFSRRLQWLTLALGLLAAIVTGVLVSVRFGVGIAIGTLLAWLNFRWLDQGLDALVAVASAQEGSPQPRVPAIIYWKLAGRYLLMASAICVSLFVLRIPLLPMVVGLLALGAGAMVECVYELFAGTEY